MPHDNASSSGELLPEAFLRSINLQLDAEHPSRISHFQPTSKTVPLVRSLLSDKSDAAYVVVAPYGSGKSITASYVLQLVEGRPEAKETLEAVEERLDAVSPELAATARQRRQAEDQGLTLALHGYQPSLPEAIREAALESMGRQALGRQARSIKKLETTGLGDVVEVLDTLVEKARDTGRDRIVILWDEFGRHLESLIAAGRASELAGIQVLAEYASRTPDIPITLALLLHRDLLQYASNLPQSVRAEWKKIDGRFRTVQYVDDSREIYRLIGEIVTSRRDGKPMSFSRARAGAKRARGLGLFPGMTQKDLAESLRAAGPLEPATLYLLPRLSARVAQNERTLFSFLLSMDHDHPVGPQELYDYFTGEMRSDMAAGGTYRQWIETESALSKVDTPMEVSCLKTACLLSLGLGGERSRVGREALSFAVAGYGSEEEAETVLQDLMERKLLLYRKHSDQVAVWHGTDFDLRGRLEEEKRRRGASFDLVGFMEEEVRAPVWRPLEYNDEYSLRRYLRGSFHSPGEIEALAEKGSSEEFLPPGCDGRILYGLVDSTAELEKLTRMVQDGFQEPRLIVALPREPVALTDAALEVRCLLELRKDRELLGADPMVEPELHQMLDDARDHLQRLVDRLVNPSVSGPRWYHLGEEQVINHKRDLRRFLSRLMREVFSETPCINNEMIVKESPSAVIINARKKLILGILEREEQEDFGIEGNGPDMSMMRTVLLLTGIFRPDADQSWAAPKDLESGLESVWREFGALLSEPADEPKSLERFIARLRRPPYGLRRGVMPILFAAGLKAFPSARALLRGDDYVEDILASHVEAVFNAPEDHRLVVRELSKDELEYLQGLHALFASGSSSDMRGTDIIRGCFDALEAWKQELPPGALTSRKLSERARRLQRLIRETTKNPMNLLLHQVPKAVGQPLGEHDRLLGELKTLKAELEWVESTYRTEAGQIIRQALRLGPQGEQTLGDAGSNWARCFPKSFVKAIPGSTARGLITRCQMGYSTDDKLLESLASLVVGKRFDRWDDAVAKDFEQKFRRAVHEIEEVAVSADATFLGGGEAVEGIAELLEGRIETLVEQLTELVGEQRAERVLSSLMTSNLERESA